MNDLHAVILDIGSRTLRYGFAGDSCPVGELSTSSHGDLCVGDVVLSKKEASELMQELRTDLMELCKIHAADCESLQWLWNYDLLKPRRRRVDSVIDSDAYLEETHLERALYDMFLYGLLVDAKSTRVLAVEPFFLPEHVKRRYTYVLLNHLHVQSVTSVPSSIMCCLAAGVKNAIVVDFGWDFTSVVPVYDLRVLQDVATTSARSAKGLHYEIAHTLLLEGKWQKDWVLKQQCGELFRMIEEMVRKGGTDVCSYLLPEREDWRHMDTQERSCVDIIGEIVESLPIDIRKPLQQSIVITGGLAKTKGLRTRIIQQLGVEYKEVFTLGAWQGTSLYSENLFRGKNLTRSGEVRRNDYLEGKVGTTDWTSEVFKTAIERS